MSRDTVPIAAPTPRLRAPFLPWATRRCGAALAVALAALACLAGPGSASDGADARLRASSRLNVLIPAYFYPDGNNWQQMCNAYRPHEISFLRRSAVAIMNPASGPGSAPDPNYVKALEYCARVSPMVMQAGGAPVGVPVVGYVATTYGARPIELVKADIDRYYRWYSVRGIFLDEMSNDAASKAYYRQLYAHIKAKADPWLAQPRGTLVVGNPGAAATTAWQVTAPVVADVLVTFEGSGESYLRWTPPLWMTQAGSAPASAFAHLVHDATGATTQAPAICAAAKQRKVGWVDVTMDRLPNPWDTMPDSRQLTYC